MTNETQQTEATTTTQEAPVATKRPKTKAVKKATPKTKAKKAAVGKGTKGPAVLRAYAPGYHKDNENKTSGGNTSVDNDDELANKLRGKDLASVYAAAAKALKEPEADLRKKYKHLNVGMQRMNLGNRMRAALSTK